MDRHSETGGSERSETSSKGGKPRFTMEKMQEINDKKNLARGHMLTTFERMSHRDQKTLLLTLSAIHQIDEKSTTQKAASKDAVTMEDNKGTKLASKKHRVLRGFAGSNQLVDFVLEQCTLEIPTAFSQKSAEMESGLIAAMKRNEGLDNYLDQLSNLEVPRTIEDITTLKAVISRINPRRSSIMDEPIAQENPDSDEARRQQEKEDSSFVQKTDMSADSKNDEAKPHVVNKWMGRYKGSNKSSEAPKHDATNLKKV
jgi:hypothetical protein